MLGAGALGRPRGMVWGGRWEEGSRWGPRVCLRQIHFDIWQNQYNIVKLKKKRYKGKEEKNAGSRKGIRRKQKKKKREKNRRLVYLCWGSSLIKDFNAFLLPTKAQQVKVMKWPNK